MKQPITTGRTRLATRRWAVIRAGVAVLAATSLVAACSSSDDEPDDTTANESNGDVEVDGDGGSAVDDGATDAGGLTSDVVGSGLVRIDGVEFGGFEGDCQINRNSGRDDVGDLSTSGLTVAVGVDDIDSQPAEELNFVMINEEGFKALNAPGGIESISESGSRTSSGSVDFATVVFAGTLDDGRAVEGEFVCALQNAF